MSQFVATDSSGRVRFVCNAEIRPMPRDGYIYHAWESPVALSAAPTPTSELRWIDNAPRWVESADLGAAKAQAWEGTRSSRDNAERGVFEFDGDWYDINKENVSGAALAALMAQLAGQPFSIDWTLADNSVKTLDGAQVQQLGIAMVRHIDTLHATTRALRQQIEAATTPEQAYAVVWPMNEHIEEIPDA